MRIVICLTVLIAVCYDLCSSSSSSSSEEEKHYAVKVYANARQLYHIPAYAGLIENKNVLVKLLKNKWDPYTSFKLCSIDHTLKLNAYCFRNNDRFHALYDTNWNIAGVRIGLVETDLLSKVQSNPTKGLKFPINYAQNKMYKKGDGWHEPYYYTDILFGEPNLFLAPTYGHDRQWRFTGKIDTLVMKLDGVWTYLPTKECDAELDGFTKQGCWQGQYYFYKMTKTSDCKDLSGVFVFFEDGELLGVGIMAFGAYSVHGRDWFESLTEREIKRIVPNSPPCFIEWVRKYGLSPIHIFFKKPKLRTCTMFGSQPTDCRYYHQQQNNQNQEEESYYDGEE